MPTPEGLSVAPSRRRPQVDPGQRSETVRRANLATIVGELHARGPLTRSEIVARTGLTRSAIRRLVGELVAAGLVTERPTASAGVPGRPSPRVHLVPASAVALGLEIEVDSLAAATVGLGGQVIELERLERPRGHGDVDEVIADLVTLAERQASHWREHPRLVGIGVAVVGLVRRSDGLVPLAPNLGWHDVPLGECVRDALGTDAPISVANEADLGALAEHRRGAAAGFDDVVFLAGEVGVGGGLIAEGRPLTGVAGYGGEIGHMPVNPITGRPCRCGSVGCWETEVSEEALLERAGWPIDGGHAAVRELLAAARAGDERVLRALDDVGRWLGIGLAGVVNVLDPSLVVLGGRFAALEPFIREACHAELERRALPPSRGPVRVVPAALGIDAPVIGAAELAFAPLLADPAGWLGPRRDAAGSIASATPAQAGPPSATVVASSATRGRSASAISC